MARVRPHFKSHVSMRTHPKTAAMYADNDLLATYHRIGHLMVERYAGRTGGVVLVSGTELCVLTSAAQVSGAVQRLKKLADLSPLIFFRSDSDPSQLPPSWRPVAAQLLARSVPVAAQSRSSGANLWVLGLPNFADKQGFGAENCTRTDKELHTSDSYSDSDTDTNTDRRGGAERKRAGLRAAPPKPEPPDPIPEAWDRLADAFRAYGREPPKLTTERRRHASARMREHSTRGVDCLAQIAHGYRARHADPGPGFDPERYFRVQTLLRPSNATEYLEAYDEAVRAGQSPPFTGPPPAGANGPRDYQAAAERRELEELLANG